MQRILKSTAVIGKSVAPARRAQRFSRSRLPVLAQALPEPSSGAGLPAADMPSSSAPALLLPMQEAINGRAAMLGFVAAVTSEAITHEAVWSQIAGKYVNMELVDKPVGQSTLLFAAVVVMVSIASAMPRLIEDVAPDARSFGPFTPGLEKALGRAAMLGFAGWLVLEKVVDFHFL